VNDNCDDLNKEQYKRLLLEAWILATVLYADTFDARFFSSRPRGLFAVHMKSVHRLQRRISNYNKLFAENISVLDMPNCLTG